MGRFLPTNWFVRLLLIAAVLGALFSGGIFLVLTIFALWLVYRGVKYIFKSGKGGWVFAGIGIFILIVLFSSTGRPFLNHKQEVAKQEKYGLRDTQARVNLVRVYPKNKTKTVIRPVVRRSTQTVTMPTSDQLQGRKSGGLTPLQGTQSGGVIARKGNSQ